MGTACPFFEFNLAPVHAEKLALDAPSVHEDKRVCGPDRASGNNQEANCRDMTFHTKPSVLCQ